MNKFSLLLFCCTLVLLSCKTSTTTLLVLQPAEMVVPEHIQTIATIDRSKPAKGFGSFLEGLITGEDIDQDPEGRRRAVNGLTIMLTKTPRFTVRHTDITLTGSNNGNRMTAPLSWQKIEKICRDYDADAVVAIESFDSDNSLSTRERTRTKKDKEGNEYIETYYEAQSDIDLRMGWRFYDPKNRVILDEFSVRERGGDENTGNTAEIAANNLARPDRLVQDVAYLIGEEYGARIAPIWITVQRNFYKSVKGVEQSVMEKAARYAETDNWDQAAEIWKKVVARQDPEAAGKAAHNMAVTSERAGQLLIAKDWANKAYLEFNNKSDKSFIRTLDLRIEEQEQVKRQMQTGN
ncbi:MAG: DUF6340 family protein [Saprospiraceae bacterium]